MKVAMAAVLVATWAAEGIASAGSDREQCVASAEQAQQLRDEGKYRRAREQLLVCARDTCPGPIKSDCGKWLTELNRDAPTVVFGARDATGDLLDVRVSMDGVVIQERMDGKPVVVDSGEHTFTFESKDGTVKEEKILLRAAEKGRLISVTFGPTGGAPAAPPPSAPVVVPSQGPQTPQEEGSIVPALVVGGIGVAALGSFALFGIGGKNDVADLQKCKPNCAETDVDSARTKLIVADISLGVGIVALGVATYMFLTRPKVDATPKVGTVRPPSSRLRLDAGPIVGGAFAGIGGKF